MVLHNFGALKVEWVKVFNKHGAWTVRLEREPCSGISIECFLVAFHELYRQSLSSSDLLTVDIIDFLCDVLRSKLSTALNHIHQLL